MRAARACRWNVLACRRLPSVRRRWWAQVDGDALRQLLVKRKITTGGGGSKRSSTYDVALTAHQCKDTRDALAKAIYQGLFDWETFRDLGLPGHWWSLHALEFHGQLSFIKGGLVFADWITTVSPTYAEEIRTPAFGCGLEGLLQVGARVLEAL